MGDWFYGTPFDSLACNLCTERTCVLSDPVLKGVVWLCNCRPPGTDYIYCYLFKLCIVDVDKRNTF